MGTHTDFSHATAPSNAQADALSRPATFPMSKAFRSEVPSQPTKLPADEPSDAQGEACRVSDTASLSFLPTRFPAGNLSNDRGVLEQGAVQPASLLNAEIKQPDPTLRNAKIKQPNPNLLDAQTGAVTIASKTRQERC
jgi:hypothetical protein